MATKLEMEKPNILWHDRKRTFLGLPWSFTKYKLTDRKFIIETGFFSKNEEEIVLYRITDLSLRRSFGQRIVGVGTIHVCSSDKTAGEFDIKSVKQSPAVKELLSKHVEEERVRNHVIAREFMDSDGHDDFDSDDDH